MDVIITEVDKETLAVEFKKVSGNTDYYYEHVKLVKEFL